MSLRMTFNLVTIGAFVIGMALAALFTRNIAEQGARRQVLHEASMLLQQATALRALTGAEAAAPPANAGATGLQPHAMASAATQTALRRMAADYPDFAYKEAGFDPTSPGERSTDWGAEIIDIFKRNDALVEHIGERLAPSGQVLTLARPFRLTDGACLACHSTPAAAPAAIGDHYGESPLFGWRLGDVIGAQIVSVPLSVPLARAMEQWTALLISLGYVFLAMLVLMNLLLHFAVIRPVQRMTAAAERVAAGELDVAGFATKGCYEIASLGRSFDLMRRSLVNAMRLLDA